MWWGTALESPGPAAAAGDAPSLGVELAEAQPQANVRVRFDPDGHPLCPCRDVD
jgi:hypothetical protein